MMPETGLLICGPLFGFILGWEMRGWLHNRENLARLFSNPPAPKEAPQRPQPPPAAEPFDRG